MTRRLRLPLLIALTFIGAGCQPEMKVSDEFGPGLSLEGMGPTFAWSPTADDRDPDPWIENPSLRAKITSLVESGLTDRGYQPASGTPDFWVNYDTTTKVEWAYITRAMVGRDGLLIIEFVDPASGRFIWRGVARTRIQKDDSLETRQKRLNRAVDMILDQMPKQRPVAPS